MRIALLFGKDRNSAKNNTVLNKIRWTLDGVYSLLNPYLYLYNEHYSCLFIRQTTDENR